MRERPRRGYGVYVPRVLAAREPTPAYWETEASLLYADLTGFTALTERLAARGKAGVERLIRHLSTIHTALLSATADGGDLLALSGDALVVLYDGPDHAGRAAHAAAGMQRALAAVGSVAAGKQRVRLRMSVGIHSDTFLCCSVGDAQLQLVVAGPAATRAVAAEAAAGPGEVLLTDAAAALVDPGWLTESRDGGRLLGAVDPLPPADIEFPDVPDERLAPYLSPPLRPVLGAEDPEHEHRLAAIGFVVVSGIDRVVVADGPAAAFAHLQAVAKTVQGAVADCGVCIISTDLAADGFAVMLAAGVPVASEDNEGRLLRAARLIVEHAGEATVRVGVNRGHLFGGDVGAPFRRTYSVMGDAVNVAARLAYAAPPGRVLAHPAVLQAAATRFAFEPASAVPAKGMAEPVPAVLVGAPMSGAPRRKAPPVPFVGRDAELALLRERLAGALAGEGAAVELVGEAGIGKSRLAEEVVRRAGAATVVRADCEPFESARPYATARQVLLAMLGIPADATSDEAADYLRASVAVHAPELERWLPLLAIPLGAVPSAVGELAPEHAPARLAELLLQLLERACDESTVIVIEDAFWMDDASREVLRLLIDDIGTRCWFLLTTRRTGATWPDATDAGMVTTVRLQPLDHRGAEALGRVAAAARAVPHHELGTLVRQAGGNPLFLVELVRSWSSAERPAALPDSVEGIAQARLDGLAAADRRALRYLAVLGGRVSDTLAGRYLARAGLLEDPYRWTRLAYLVERDGGTLGFRHDLFRTVAYESLTFAARRRLHGIAGDVLAEEADGQPAPAGLLSLHFHRAERWEAAWRWSVTAGDEARGRFANREAAAAYERALDAAARLPTTDPRSRPPPQARGSPLPDPVAEVAERLGDVRELVGAYPDAAEAYRRARAAAPTPDAQTRLLRKQGLLRERSGDYRTALCWYRRAMGAAEAIAEDRERLSALAHCRLAYAGVRYRQGRLRDAVSWASEAERDAEAAGDRAALAHAYYLLDAVYTDLGDPAALDYRGRALPLLDALGDLVGQANVLNNLGINAYYEGRWAEAADCYRRSRELRERVGDVVGAATAMNNLGEILSDLGWLDEATALFREAMNAWRWARYPLGEALALTNLGRAAGREGRHGDALAALEEARRRLDDLGADALALEVDARTAEVLLDSGEPADALDLAARTLAALAERGADRLHRPLLELVRGGALAALGRADEARDCYDRSLAAADEIGSAYARARTLEALADLTGAAEPRAEAAALRDRLSATAALSRA